ncbi:MAG: ABC transporter ATP-binding protein [Lactobacillus sp.]|jgi:ABC-2 type transport system ATP-binding protein|nr:ABC transporter ATP-binding protein [Lactobacillus sp.]
MTVLSIKNLNYSKHRKLILQGVCLDLEPGKIVALLGANGAGKTTLMRIISGQAKHWHGQVLVNGKQKDEERKACVSFTDQLSGFSNGMKIAQIADFYEQVFPDFDREEYRKLQQFMNLSPDARLRELSRGMKEKLIISLTFARQVPLYLLDEPFSGIDVMARKRIINSILLWKNEQATILLSDHFVNEIASVLDEVVIVKNQTVLVKQGADDIRAKGQSIEQYYEGFYQEDEND